MSGLAGLAGRLGGTHARLVAVLALSTVAVGVLAWQAAGSSLSYYAVPEEFAQEIDPEGRRWRVGGRVVEGSIVEDARGRPVAWTIAGDAGETVEIAYEGAAPGLFGPRAFVVIEGVATAPGRIEAEHVIIRHEPEFVTDPADASIAAPR